MNRGSTSEEAKAKMRASWTPKRRAKQRARALAQHRKGTLGGIPGRIHKTLENWNAIRSRPKKWHSIKRRTTVVPFLLEGVDVQVLIAYTLNGCIQVTTRWRRVHVINGQRAPRWTPEARRAQAERLAKVRYPGHPKEFMSVLAKESHRRKKLRRLWTPEKRQQERQRQTERMRKRPSASMKTD